MRWPTSCERTLRAAVKALAARDAELPDGRESLTAVVLLCDPPGLTGVGRGAARCPAPQGKTGARDFWCC